MSVLKLSQPIRTATPAAVLHKSSLTSWDCNLTVVAAFGWIAHPVPLKVPLMSDGRHLQLPVVLLLGLPPPLDRGATRADIPQLGPGIPRGRWLDRRRDSSLSLASILSYCPTTFQVVRAYSLPKSTE